MKNITLLTLHLYIHSFYTEIHNDLSENANERTAKTSLNNIHQPSRRKEFGKYRKYALVHIISGAPCRMHR